MTTRTWQQIIDAVPEVHPGQRGVSAEIEAALAYIRRQDLAITRRDRLSTHISRQLPSCQRVLSGRGQAAYYSEPERIVPGAWYRQAHIEAAASERTSAMTTTRDYRMYMQTADGRRIKVVRDVCHRHPDEVHQALGTSSEAELQGHLDCCQVDDWYDRRTGEHRGPDDTGLVMEWID